jgi:hypothetical protein
MNVKYLAALMTASMLVTAPAFAQSATAQKQHTQEGGNSESFECGAPFNANPAADPDCKQHTQNLTPSSFQFDQAGARK